MNLSILHSLALALGCAALSSCDSTRNNATTASDPYAPGNAYQPPAAAAQPGYGGYGTPAAQPGAYDTGSGAAYTPPAYNPPAYTPPAAPQPYVQSPAGSGYSSDPGTGYEATPAAAPRSGSGRTHVVVKEDTLSGISRRYGVSVNELKRANNLNSDLIRLGQKLSIP